MTVMTIEGFVDEEGRIQLLDDIALPQNTRVYILIPDALENKKRVHIYSPRLAKPEDVADFRLEVEDWQDAEIR